MPQTRDSHAAASATALAGATVVVTRPTAMADALLRGARRLGAVAVRLPGLSLRARSETTVAESLRAARGAHAWIFISPSAARFAFACCPDLSLPPSLQVWTVGAGTADALARHGIRALVPEATQDSDGLLIEPELASLRGKHVVIVDAPGGRAVLAPSLQQRGATVERIHVYERLPPRLTARHFDTLAAAPQPWISLISSGEALAHLHAALPADLCARWRAQPLVVSSPRLAQLAAELQFDDVLVARSALSADLLNAAQTVLSRHRL